VQRIEGDGAVRDLEFAEQLLRGGDLVGRLVDIDMRQDQVGFGVERVQQLSRMRCTAYSPVVARIRRRSLA
jgi:hypothetical protein